MRKQKDKHTHKMILKVHFKKKKISKKGNVIAENQ